MLEKIDSTKVFTYFEEISCIPRGSGNNTAISNYLVDFAKKHQLEYEQDACENVIIRKAGSKGFEDKPTVILQGHMDMVCEKEADCQHDFLKEPLDIQIDGDYVYAKGTTLGGDDGIAVAYALAILDDDTIVHPPIEVVITTDEETGMDGAIGLDASKLKGTYFINIDSEEEGTILTSCAGGMSVNGTYQLDRKEAEGIVIELTVSGMQGGHSGTEIDKNRENAVLSLGRMLAEMQNEKLCFDLISIDGGLKDNAIPRDAKAKILISDIEVFANIFDKIVKNMKNEVSANEPEACFAYVQKGMQKTKVFSNEVKQNLIFFLEQTPNGVQKMSAVIPGLVESSLNLGICRTEEKEVFLSFSIRSSVQSYKQYLGQRMKHLIESTGGAFEKKSEYPAWEYRADSPLRELCVKVYKEQYGESPKIEAIHAGLECGILADKNKALDMVSIGPDIYDIHTPKERLVISSTQRVYKFVLGILKEICQK